MPWKSTRLLATVAATALMVTACGSGDDSDDDSSETRTITDAQGTEVEIPTDPQRVVALSEQDLDAMVALDIEPVGTLNGRGQTTPPAYLGDSVDNVEVVGDIGEFSVDAVLELEPDLVLFGAAHDQDLLEQVRDLIPATVMTYDLDAEWHDAFRNTAEALNEEDAAEAWLTEYESAADDIADSLGDNGDSDISLVRWSPDGPSTMHRDAFASLVLQDLGLNRPESQQEEGFSHSDPLSLENLSLIDADWLFVGTLVEGSEGALQEALDTPAFAQLEAVENDRFIEVDGTLWTSRGGPVAAELVAEEISEHLGEDQ